MWSLARQVQIRGAAAVCRQQRFYAVPSWATVDPDTMSGANPAIGQNLVGGVWTETAQTMTIPDPMNGEGFLKLPNTQIDELAPFEAAANAISKSGMHNPFKNPERYTMIGDVSTQVARRMAEPEVERFFWRLIQRLVCKSDAQCKGEPVVTRKWMEYMSGDQIRMLARSFGVPGDHPGQETRGYRFPYGHVTVITPFNFPLEIPALQSMSALFMGNRPTVKVDERVSIVYEQFVRLMIDCGLPAEDVDVIHCNGAVFNEFMLRTMPRMTLFTGSQVIAEKLTQDMRGRVKLEDAGFDWKILGPDVMHEDYVAWQSDQDAYAFSGQKCSAQSILFAHENWMKAGIVDKLAAHAGQRSLDDGTLTPILSVNNTTFENHVKALLAIPGAHLCFGGNKLEGHSIPDRYGSFDATAVFVPISEAIKDEHFDTVITEIFGPLQVITEYADDETDLVLEMCERMESHLTAAIVSSDNYFINKVLGHTINGTTYAGHRARTTGAPQQHWFGPAGDPRSGGIHTVEAIQQVWSCHREVIVDQLAPKDFIAPAPT